MIGPLVGPYRVVRELGSGGMGTVLLAEDTRLRRLVALKTIRAGADDPAHAQELLLREARAAAAINHPHVAAVYDVLRAGDDVAIVSEFCEGETLAVRLRHGPLETGEAVRIAAELADGLAAAHAKGVVHRDLKPANVMLGPGGGAKILDFGIARLTVSDRATTGADGTTIAHGFVGTPDYAAPEQWSGAPADARTDLYALGEVLFEMAAGRRPFSDSDPWRLAARKRHETAPRLTSVVPGAPRELDDLVASLLAGEPSARPSDARTVSDTLRRFHEALTHPPPPQAPPQRHHPWAWAFVAVLSLAVLGGAAWLQWRPAAAAPRAPVVAVLPLSNATGDPSKDYLAAGVADSLVIGLASLKHVTVLSREVVADARSRKSRVGDLARDLDASYLVQGSLQQVGDEVRLSLTVLQPDGAVAWGDSVEGPATSLFDLQARLAGALTRALLVEVTPGERQELRDAPTDTPEALQAYWQGRALLDRRDRPGNLEGAIAAFSQATSLDPRFALAHAALGEAYWAQWNDTKDRRWVDKAIEEGTTALRIDPERPEVRYALALTLVGSGRTVDAIEELQRALSLRPGYEEARRLLGTVLVAAGRVEEGIAEFDRAIAARPNAGVNWSAKGRALYLAARYRDAVVAFTRATELQPDNHLAYQQLGVAYQMEGNDPSAVSAYEHSIAIRPSAGAYANLGALHHQRGDFVRAVDAYVQSLKLRPNSAIVHRNLGDALRKQGKLAAARGEYRAAVELAQSELAVNPRDARLHAALAVYAMKAGDRATALREVAEALALARDDPDVLYRAAVVYALGHEREQSAKYLVAALQAGYSRAQATADEDLASTLQVAAVRSLVGDVNRRPR